MDYELLEELKQQLELIIETKNNPKEVIQTLAELIDYVVEWHL